MWAVRKLWIVILVEGCPTWKKLKTTREMTSLEKAGRPRGPEALSSHQGPHNLHGQSPRKPGVRAMVGAGTQGMRIRPRQEPLVLSRPGRRTERILV